MFADNVQTSLQYATLVIGIVTLVYALLNLSVGHFILSVSIIQAVHFVVFLSIKFFTLPLDSTLYQDWVTVLRLHSSATALVLTIYIVMCRQNGGTDK